MADFRRVAVGDLGRSVQVFLAQTKAARPHRSDQALVERLFHVLEGNAILRELWSGQARLDGAQVQFDHVGEIGIRRRIGTEEALLLGVALDQIDQLGRTTGIAHVVQRLVVDREEAHRCPIFRAHVADGRPVGQGHIAEAGAEIFHEFAHDALFAQHLGDAQDEVGGRGSFGQAAGQANADDFRGEHIDWLAEHDRLGLDAADTPPEHTQAVDHRRVRVSADKAIGESHLSVVLGLGHHHLAQIFQVDLMDNAGGRRDNAEVLERALAPFEELVALAIALELALGVEEKREGRAELIHLHRVIDDEIDGDNRVDALGAAAQPGHCRAHGRQVDDRRHAGEVLQNDSSGFEGNLEWLGHLRRPARQPLDILGHHFVAVGCAQDRLQQYFDRKWQPINVGEL